MLHSLRLMRSVHVRSIRVRCIGLLLAVWVAVWGAPAYADDLVTSRAVMTDPGGSLEIQDAVAAWETGRFKSAGPILVAGFSDAAHWLRITVRPPPDGDRFELRIRPTFLDEVALYAPDPGHLGTWLERLTGDRHVNADRPATTLGFGMEPLQAETTYYLRLQTTSSALLAVQALTPAEARADDLNRHFIHMAYLGVMLAMAVLALYGLIGLRSRLAAVFLLYLGAQTASFIALNGYLAHFMPAGQAQWGDTLTSILVLFSVFTGVLFYRAMFGGYAASTLGVRLLDAAMLLCVVNLCLLALGQARLALQISSNIVLMLALAAPLIALSMRGGPERERRIVGRLVWLQALALCIMMLPLVGLLSSRVEWIVDAPLSQGVVAALVMGAILHLRIRGLSEARQRAETDTAVTRELLDAERQRADEQARFMDMLTHELKTPIAAAKLVLQLPDASDDSRRHALATLADMDAVVERCRQLDQLEQGRFAPRLEPCRLDELLAETLASCRTPARIGLSAEPLPTIESDRHLLKIILSNLIDNALKYSASGSTIECRLEPHALDGRPHVRFIIDNPPGPAGLPDPDRLFDKYYRSPHAHQYTGSGLGLYLIRHLADRLAGRLVYEPVHQRARFTLWIPA
ncbi:MAG: 7TM-DISM domain-containing protein [Castellaniella sp.]|uniref:sensor histidine kinase n=1 Tax=Castellaniella sp. TaxID=1955812 RepID=UPI003C749E8B